MFQCGSVEYQLKKKLEPPLKPLLTLYWSTAGVLAPLSRNKYIVHGSETLSLLQGAFRGHPEKRLFVYI